MLEKIIAIKNIGLFGGTENSNIEMKKHSVIYAGNGRGKSTLASLLRACSQADTESIIKRKTIDTSDDDVQSAKLLFSNDSPSPPMTQVAFENETWSSQREQISVFDSDFVDKNVYSGFEISPQHREKLLNFAMGEEAVKLQQSLEDLEQQRDAKNKEKAGYKKHIEQNFLGSKITDVLAIENVEDLEIYIQENEKALANAQKADSLHRRPTVSTIATIEFDFQSLERLLSKTLDDVVESAEEKVNSHIEQYPQSLESWINDGQEFVKANSESCPFCAQPIEGIELIRAYKNYFDEEYAALKAEVQELKNQSNRSYGQSLQTMVAKVVTENSNTQVIWQDEIPFDIPAFEQDAYNERAVLFKNLIIELLEKKAQSPLEPVEASEKIKLLKQYLEDFNNQISEYNQGIKVIEESITNFKGRLTNLDLDTLLNIKRDLVLKQKRFSEPAVGLVADYNKIGEEIDSLAKEIKANQAALTEVTKKTLSEYNGRVNELIEQFYASFKIENLGLSHQGKGNPKSKYTIGVRGQDVKLENFDSALSEADKRTLALAFFIAKVDKDETVKDRIIVLDDPVSSLDKDRRTATIAAIIELAKKCRQLIVLSHDHFFVRELNWKLEALYEGTNDKPIVLYELKRSRNSYSAIQPCDIELKCKSKYYKNYDLVTQYVDGDYEGDDEKVAEAIRKLLEGYLHRKFPQRLPKNTQLGDSITLMKNDIEAKRLKNEESVYINFENDIEELRTISKYGSKSMHDTASDYDPSLEVNPRELERFAQRTLNIIHR